MGARPDGLAELRAWLMGVRPLVLPTSYSRLPQGRWNPWSRPGEPVSATPPIFCRERGGLTPLRLISKRSGADLDDTFGVLASAASEV